ncbi:hypothetical protein BSFA1_79490 (plasmid) [Burkholderia sp. SFA1]|uniref:Uncharacterized protein n=1 Tax=Burkholderia vietnamiensis (strain G4 / LMG 22486) TaxID=269482 RepID=A4JTX2_BURVG|nr:hypothetical protein Bcep1808_6838 [Burkholderia vietnamiensis G4]AET95217.1 hypothetical protein BYI23_E000560 [Burkholderia sp. YI23]MCB4350116.1 hypothetical protein [Burkholderia vietnamiensis]BBQ02821.1 hypothetical protein BSFA1_79490 [Burkholderia sp. SFA1]
MNEHGPYCDERVSFSSSEYNAGFSVSLYIDGGIRSVAALESLNKALDRPFGTVRLAVRALTWALHQDGYLIEFRPTRSDTWNAISEPKFDADSCYRVLPKAGLPMYDTAPESHDDF